MPSKPTTLAELVSALEAESRSARLSCSVPVSVRDEIVRRAALAGRTVSQETLRAVRRGLSFSERESRDVDS